MSSFETVTRYQMATKNLYRIGGPLLIILGSIGGLLSLYVFRRRSMRKKSGSIYFIAFNISNILLLWINLVPFVYRYTTGTDLTLSSLIYCRLRTYVLNVFIILPPSYLILASIDRTFITSRNALIRQRSTRRLAFITISAITLLWLLYYFPTWFFVHIQILGPSFAFCFFDTGPYSVLMKYSTMTISGFLPPVIMAILGFMTLKNFRRVQVQPIINENRVSSLLSKDRQLVVILLFEIAISIVFSTVGSILFVYTQRIPNDRKTMEQQDLDFFLLDFGLYLVFVQASISPYANFVVSKQFRRTIYKFFLKTIPRSCCRLLHHDSTHIQSNTLKMTIIQGTIQMPSH